VLAEIRPAIKNLGRRTYTSTTGAAIVLVEVGAVTVDVVAGKV
jgi:hypothetical protein